MADDAAVKRVMPLDEHRTLLAETRAAAGYDGGDFAAWRERAKRVLAGLVGYEIGVDRRAFAVEVMWARDIEMGRIKKLVLRSPGVADMPMLWCVPAGARGRLPAIICLQGHTAGMHVSAGMDDGGGAAAVEGDRDFALQCLRNGVAAVCVEQRGFGERRDNPANAFDCVHMSFRAMMLGRTLIGERVSDVRLALRWLMERPEVDNARIGAIGNSAGGTTAMYAAALLEEIRLAVVSCSFGRLRDTWFNPVRPRCACGYVPGMAGQLDLPDVLALHAPRPVVVVGAEADYHCPGEHLREAFGELSKRYAACGSPEGCQLVIGPGGHRFYAELAWPWIRSFLFPKCS